MNKSTTSIFSCSILLLSTCNSANATLISRLDGQAFYDTNLNITWLADANLAASNTFGVSGISSEGKMSWDVANQWIDAMNTYNGTGYLGFNDWRMPIMTDTFNSGCDFSYSGTDCGFNSNTTTSEMASLFYDTLGNTAYYDEYGMFQTVYGLTNTNGFINFQSSLYWYGVEYAADTNNAWYFNFIYGGQLNYDKNFQFHTLAVRSGDVSNIPVPASIWLFMSGVTILSFARRKINNK